MGDWFDLCMFGNMLFVGLLSVLIVIVFVCVESVMMLFVLLFVLFDF